jgi:membrane protein DedA with SNARE-associated domain/rhodanese-related sulfurtransferase
MNELIVLVEQYGLLVVFVNVLVQQAGVPVPVYPTLILAGALLPTSRHSAGLLVAIAVGAAVTADSLWYFTGRHFGTSALSLLCRLSLTPDVCVRQTISTFERHGPAALLVAKFVPGIAALAAALAGIVGIRYLKFFLFDVAGALLWVIVAIGVGYMSRSAIGDFLQWIEAFGKWVFIVLGVLLAVYLLYKWRERRRFEGQIEMERISVDRLQQMMSGAKKPTILDVRPVVLQSALNRIPGARLIHADRIPEGIAGLNPSDEIVVYCSCPNEATAAIVTRELWRRGFRNVRPLKGGIDAWMRAGFPVESAQNSQDK